MCATTVEAEAQGRTLHVASSGSDAAPGTAEQPLRTVQKAVNSTRPGDSIAIHAGTYDGLVVISRSGVPGEPIMLGPAGDGTVTLHATLPPESCAESDPTQNRTVQLLDGTDDWRIQGLTIQGGIFVAGSSLNALSAQVRNRRLPGRGAYDPAAAEGTLRLLGSDPADRVEILDNVITGRGIFVAAARTGRIEGNEIRDVQCGTGGAIWLNRFSDGWIVRDNHVHGVAGSGAHYMSEGIRLGASSMYNTIEDNQVEDVGGTGRGITTDANAGWNLIQRNVVRRADHGYSEQKGGWGNRWIANLSEDNRRFGFAIYNLGFPLSAPNDDVPAYVEMRCNKSVGDPVAFNANGVQKSRFAANAFEVVMVSENLKAYWSAAGNTWDGSPKPPAARPPSRFEDDCAASQARLWGVVDRDGRVEKADATIVLQRVAGLQVEGEIDLADVDADGTITSRDALLIKRYSQGLDVGAARVGRPAP
jgi:hypothetical protein